MKKYKFENTPVASITLCIFAIVLMVSTIILEVLYINVWKAPDASGTAYYPLTILEIIAFVFFIAVLSMKKSMFFLIINTALNAIVTFTFFILTIVEFAQFVRDFNVMRGVYFALSLFGLIAAILHLIYFIVEKNSDSNKLERISNMAVITIIGLFAIAVITFSVINAFVNKVVTPFHTSFLLVGLLLLTAVPVFNNRYIVKE